MSEPMNGQHFKPFDIMPAPEGTCPECACKHQPYQPHNQQSLFYKYKFYNEHGRWPSWKDAMSHCKPDIKRFWIEALMERGIEIDGIS